MGRRVLITGLASFWGGLVAKALEQDDSVEVIVGLDTREPAVELERTEYVRSDENYSILSRIVQATQVDTIVHTFLIVDSTSMRPRHDARDQRHRHHEPVRGRLGPGQHRARRGGQVVELRLRHGQGGPGVVLRADAAQPPGPQPGRAQPGERRGLRARLRRGQPARERVAAALRQRARARHRHPHQPGAASCRWCRRSSASTPASSSCTRTTWCAPSCSCSTATCPASTTWPATGCCRGARWPSCAASAPSPCRPSAPGWPPGPCNRIGVPLPGELLDLLRYGRGIDNRRLKQAGFRVPVHLGRRGQGLHRGGPAAPDHRLDRAAPTATSATSSSSSATPPPSSATAS